MNAVAKSTHAAPGAASSVMGGKRAKNAEEAAQQFEAVLVRQFVKSMTKELFKTSLGGDSATQATADMQRDALTDALTDDLVQQGAFGIKELLLQHWPRGVNATPHQAPAPSSASDAP